MRQQTREESEQNTEKSRQKSESPYHRVRNPNQQEARRTEVMRLYLTGYTERGISRLMKIDRETVRKDLEAAQEKLAETYASRYVEAEIESELEQLRQQKEDLLIMASKADDDKEKRSINKEIREINMFLARFYQTIEGRQYALMGNGEREYQPN